LEVAPVEIALFAIFLVVLIGPFTIKMVEHNLEAFLFIMGAIAVTVTGKWGAGLIEEAVSEPITKGIVPAVLVAGLIFFYGKAAFEKAVNRVLNVAPMRVLVFVIVVVLGLLSSVITAIIAALLLVEIANLLPLARKDKINLVVVACFSIGLGAVLTPLGEPLSTIAVVKLSGPPYFANFWYLFDQLGVLVALGVIGCGLFGVFYVGKKAPRQVKKLVVATDGGAMVALDLNDLPDGQIIEGLEAATDGGTSGAQESVALPDVREIDQIEAVAGEGGLKEVLLRAVKVYAFVAALFLLGAGMEVIITKYFTQLPSTILFWLNMLSAVLDNATLTAAEIGPALTQEQINAALMGLLVSGGMLIPGNIPNIVSAGKLGITSSEWAKLGVPLGLALNAIYFVAIFFLGFSPRVGIP